MQPYSIILYCLLLSGIAFSCKTAKQSAGKTTAADTTSPKASDERMIKNDSTAVANITKTDAYLEKLLQQYPQYFNSILQHKDEYKLQIIYTQIDRDANNRPGFKDYYFNVNPAHYFYPASTVKMPTAALALQKLNELHIDGVNEKTTMITESGYSGETSVYNDPTTFDGSPDIEHYIKKIFLTSDNDAFNRLYEFTGQQYINQQLHTKGYKSAEICHRLNIFLSQDQNRHTNPVQFRDTSGNVLYNQPLQYNTDVYAKRNDMVGKGYYKGGVLINEPMNFSQKNNIALDDLHNVLRSILFPAAVPEKQRFNLTQEQYQLLWKYMSQLPRETDYPSYDSTYFDAYVKYLLLGGEKNAKLPDGVRIFNKIGAAYGFLIDVAYIVDFKNNIEFMLSAVIYCNKDDIINDDTYEYETVGFPFMKNLGQVIYDQELKRTRRYVPDLNTFKLQYDK
ncbi:MAG: serine hydrolase [Agriterribacter sp.]